MKFQSPKRTFDTARVSLPMRNRTHVISTKHLRGSSASKESVCDAGDPGSILGQEDPLENR